METHCTIVSQEKGGFQKECLAGGGAGEKLISVWCVWTGQEAIYISGRQLGANSNRQVLILRQNKIVGISVVHSIYIKQWRKNWMTILNKIC